LRIWEALLGLLKEGGVDGVKAAWGVDLLTLYVTAIAAEQSIREGDQALARACGVLSAVSAEEFPLLFAARTNLLSGGGEARGAWALDVIIDGIVGGTSPKAAKRRRRVK
jgi:hypothetical protein